MPDTQWDGVERLDDGTEAREGGYRIIRSDERLSREFRDRYWQRVKRVLCEIFEANEELADRAREKLEERGIDKRSQTLFYHAEPLEVAADLAGHTHKAINPQHRLSYQRMLALSPLDSPPLEPLDCNHVPD